MLIKPWQEALRMSLTLANDPESRTRLAIMGIGHELCGDDAVGMHMATSLRRSIPDDEHLLIVEAGAAPENFTSVLRRFHPDLVLLIDAAEMGTEPGEIRWLDCQTLDGVSASTHTLPLSILVGYLQTELHCEMACIGIQPEQTFYAGPLSRRVRKAAREVVREISDIMMKEQLRRQPAPVVMKQ